MKESDEVEEDVSRELSSVGESRREEEEDIPAPMPELKVGMDIFSGDMPTLYKYISARAVACTIVGSGGP